MKKTITLLAGLTLVIFASENITLTPEYMTGKWCLIQEESLDEMDKGKIDKHNDIWEFTSDGKVMKQTTSYSTKLKHKSDWKLEDNKLKMKPSHIKRFFGYKTITASKDELIFEHRFITRYYMKRGVCSEKSKIPGLE